ncbi:MAG TPA: hypothetical protein VM183_13145 [Burkholderiales bacterium]|nr:hypothetical protein [Burkholderiales bacterium]
MRPSVGSPVPECPVAPASRESTYARVLHRACLIVGGVAPLAHHLGVAEVELQKWLHGMQDPPYDVFLGAVEIVLLNLEAPGRAT